MKRTTYIIFGMLLAGLVGMCGWIFYISTQGISRGDSFLEITGGAKTVQLPECKVVLLVADRDVIGTRDNGAGDIRMVGFNNAPLKVCPAETAQATFTYASGMDKHMKIEPKGDTLCIRFSFANDKLDKQQQDLYWLNLHSQEMILALPANVQRVVSNLESQTTTFKGFDSDTLSFSMNGRVDMENCRFRALHVRKGNLNFNSGDVKNLHLNLDDINNWNINTESFHIDTEYLYASGHCRCTLEEKECRQVIWIPQSKGASLNIELKEAAKVVVQE